MSLVAQLCSVFVTPWTVAHQAPLSMGIPRQKYLSGLPFPPPGDLPNPGIKYVFPALTGRFFTAEPSWKPPLNTTCQQFFWLYILKKKKKKRRNTAKLLVITAGGSLWGKRMSITLQALSSNLRLLPSQSWLRFKQRNVSFKRLPRVFLLRCNKEEVLSLGLPEMMLTLYLSRTDG